MHLGVTFEHTVTRFEIEDRNGQRWEVIEEGAVGLRLRCLGTSHGADDTIAVFAECSNVIRVHGVVPPGSQG